jgi:hypothetical protein
MGNNPVGVSSVDDQQLFARYVAGELSEAEAVAVEERVALQPEVYREFDNILRLKEGLAVLKERGELDRLVGPRNRARAWVFGAAAAAALIGIAVWIWRTAPSSSPAMLALSPSALMESGSTPLAVGVRYVFAATRGPSSSVEIAIPPTRAAIEIKLVPLGVDDRGHYRAVITRVDVDGRKPKLSEIDGVPFGSDGYVTIYIDSARLEPGIYELSLEDENAVARQAADRFEFQAH